MELPQKPVVLVGAREILGVVKETRIGFALTGQFGKTYHLNEMDIAGAFTQPKYADGINYLVVDKDHLDLVGAFKELNPRIRAYAVAASPDEIRNSGDCRTRYASDSASPSSRSPRYSMSN